MTMKKKGMSGVLLFAVRFWLPHVKIILLAVFLILFSTTLNIVVPQLAKDIITTFDSNAEFNSSKTYGISAHAFIPTPSGLMHQCLLVSAVIILYHAASFFGHKMAYIAGQRIHNTIIESVLISLLETPHLDRIAVVSPVKLSQILLFSARTSSDVIGALLTDVLSSVWASVALLCILLYMSVTLTVTIIAILVSFQFVLWQMRHQHQSRKKELVIAESDVQTLTTNAIQRAATIRVFDAESVIMKSLQKRLQHLSKINSDVLTTIHSQAGISSALTGLLFVLILAITNIYRKRGELDTMDIVMYYMIFYQFIGRIQGLLHDYQRIHVLLDGLNTLRQLVVWCEVDHIVWRRIGMNPSTHHASPIEKEDSTTQAKGRPEDTKNTDASISLESVTYVYPEVPAFLLDSRDTEANGEGGNEQDAIHRHVDFVPLQSSATRNGVHDVTFTIPAGSITAIYGPSGSGKSTCLRILAGLLQPQKGRVHTHAKLALLEQEQAVLLGSVADNVLMSDVSASMKMNGETAHDILFSAMRHSGCDTFVKNPFHTLIQSPDKAQFSGGQLQRICMARLFARKDCTLLLFDEPTTGLDAENVETLIKTLSELNNVHHKTIVFATHDRRLLSIANNIIDINSHKHN